MDGIHKKLEPGEENAADAKPLPGNLKDAIVLFEQDPLMKEVLGEELTKIYAKLKNDEWNDYMLQVSDWEVGRYLVKM